MAFLIGSPLCCCAASGHQATQAKTTSSCCHPSGGTSPGKKSPEDHQCGCKAKDARELAKTPDLPGSAGVDLPIAVAEPIRLPEPTVTAVVVDRLFFPGSDPPRSILARLSRWLI